MAQQLNVIARHAVPKQSRATRDALDCFVASLLAMTEWASWGSLSR
jgi:hypothetical protein